MERRNRKDDFQQGDENHEAPFEDADGPDSFDEGEDLDRETIIRAGFELMFGTRREWRGSKDQYDALFEDFRESFAENFEGGHDDSSRRRSKGQKRPNKEADGDRGFGDPDDGRAPADRQSEQGLADRGSRLKTLYRTLARKLHPDVNVQKRKDLWYQVQGAYEARDIERLETLSAMSAVFDDNAQSIESVWSLKGLYGELRSGLSHLEKQIRRCSKDVAWSFEKVMKQPNKLKRLHEKLSSQMAADRDELSEHIEHGERQLEQWKAPPRPKARPNPGPSSRRSPAGERERPQWTRADMDAYTGFGKKGS